jgi:hypothetical protein
MHLKKTQQGIADVSKTVENLFETKGIAEIKEVPASHFVHPWERNSKDNVLRRSRAE